MGPGAKIAKAALKVARKVPGSDKPVRLMITATPTYDPATEERPAPVAYPLVDLGQALDVRNISQHKAVALTGNYEAGDLELVIPGAAVTEAQIRSEGAFMAYGDRAYDIMRIDPYDIAFGTVIMWRLMVRMRANGSV